MMFLYLISTGMNDPMRPEWGSWAGRYARNPAFPDREVYWATAQDTWNGTTHRENTLARWAADLQNDFRARMDWCVATNFAGANHPPRVVLNKNINRAPLPIFARSNASVELSAEGTSDPDAGQQLTYSWFVYKEAGTFKEEVELSATNGIKMTIVKPLVGLPKTIHIILRVQDNGEPPLASYRRAVVNLQP